MKIYIHKIKSQYIMCDEEFKWLMDNIGKELPVMGLLFDDEGNLSSVSLYHGEHSAVTLFKQNGAVFSLTWGTQVCW